jgi:threonine/homoserine/homoserine lactone efflux protein
MANHVLLPICCGLLLLYVILLDHGWWPAGVTYLMAPLTLLIALCIVSGWLVWHSVLLWRYRPKEAGPWVSWGMAIVMIICAAWIV